MGQKVHPHGFRLGITQEHKSNWFAKPSKKGDYSRLIAEDTAIRNVLFQHLRGVGLTDVYIKRHADVLQVILYVLKPRYFTKFLQGGDPNANVEDNEAKSSVPKEGSSQPGSRSLTKTIASTLKNTYQHSLIKQLIVNRQVFNHSGQISDDHDNQQISVIIKRSSPYNARAIAEQIKDDLQKRAPFRRALKQALNSVRYTSSDLTDGIYGIKIQISGRLNGAEMARTEWTREGQVPLHTLRAKIDYCYLPAFTSYGVLGIKVWLHKAEENR